jgi:hypothetical protein
MKEPDILHILLDIADELHEQADRTDETQEYRTCVAVESAIRTVLKNHNLYYPQQRQ